MKKMILKCKLRESLDDFEDKLEEVEMEFSPAYWLNDRVYVPRGYKKGKNFPRLIMRTEMKSVDKAPKYSLILKRHIEDSGVDVVEKVDVKDYSEMVAIIFQLGFKLAKEFSRRRREINLGAGTMIYLDNLDNDRGYYVKLETEVMEGESLEGVRGDLMRTMKVLGMGKTIETPYFES